MTLGAIYLLLLPLFVYVSGNKDSLKLLTYICLVLLADIYSTKFIPFTGGDNFFLFRTITELTILLLAYKSSVIPQKKIIVAILTFIAIIINLYLCFELDNVFIYRHWELINLMLCELIFITLLISDKMFSHRIFTRKEHDRKTNSGC